MALTDVVFGTENSAAASRGNSGVLVDILLRNKSGLVSPTFYGGYWTVTETFKTSADANVPDGTVISAYHATTNKLVGSGTTTAGVASFQVTTPNDVYLVTNPSGLSGETVCTTNITPS